MREIKFREYRGDGKWHYWGLMDEGKFISPCSPNSIAYQFTGFKDKNAKDIYDGDILRYWDGTDKAHYKIYWDESQSRFFDTRLEDGDSQTNYDGFEFVKDCEVIGNIHENPELYETLQANISKIL
jgi:uncharacterized phage protein (TIGR01671 family)